MTELRKKRLLLLARYPSGDHKRFYRDYCKLRDQGLTGWQLGFAYLTPQGELELKRLEDATTT